MSRKSLVAVAVALTLATVLAVGTTIAYARAARNGKELMWGAITAIPGDVQQSLPDKPAGLPGLGLMLRGIRGALGLGPRVQMSEEYKEKVIEIALKDPDVSKLIEEGYNITGVRPVIKAYVEADGSVSLKADEAVVALRKKGSIALVLVNLKEERVTKIAIRTVTVTVIEK